MSGSVAHLVVERLDGCCSDGRPVTAGGDRRLYTDKTARYLAHDVIYMARILKPDLIPTNLSVLMAEAKKVGR